MAVTVTHATVTAVPDDPAYDIGSDEWNAAHTVTNALDKTGDTMTGALTLPQHPDNLRLATSETPVYSVTSLSSDYGTYKDNTMQVGFNCAGGSRTDTGDIALYLQWESKYLSGANYICEWHLNYIGTDGTQRRLFQGDVDRGTHAATFGISANQFYIHNDASGQLLDINSTGHVGINYPGMTCTLEVQAVDTNLPALRLRPNASIGAGETIFDVVDSTAGTTFRIAGGASNWAQAYLVAPSGQANGAAFNVQSVSASKQLQLAMDGSGNAVIGSTGPMYLDFKNQMYVRDNGTGANTPLTYSSGLWSIRGDVETTRSNGQAIGLKTLTELLTIAAAATSTTTIQKPAHSIILGVSVRVTTAVTCTSTFTVGDSTSAARFSTAAVSKAAGSTDKGTKAGAYYNATAEGIIITPDTVPSDATGRVRVTIHYLEVTPPTS